MSEPEWLDRIKTDPGVMHGRPVVKGTRVLVEVLVGNLGTGASIEDVCKEFRVSEADVRAALMYAAEVVAAEGRHALPAG
jgi:uncharacterized protein (DUF433 family)